MVKKYIIQKCSPISDGISAYCLLLQKFVYFFWKGNDSNFIGIKLHIFSSQPINKY